MKLRTAKKICKRAVIRSVGDMRRYDTMESVLPGWTREFSAYSRRQIYTAIRRVQRWERERHDRPSR